MSIMGYPKVTSGNCLGTVFTELANQNKFQFNNWANFIYQPGAGGEKLSWIGMGNKHNNYEYIWETCTASVTELLSKRTTRVKGY